MGRVGHKLVPLVVEDEGHFGPRARQLLRDIAWRGVRSGHLRTPPGVRVGDQPAIVSHWVGRWLQDISFAMRSFHARELLSVLDTFGLAH